MSPDYILLIVVAVICLGGGTFLLWQAKRYRARQDIASERETKAR